MPKNLFERRHYQAIAELLREAGATRMLRGRVSTDPYEDAINDVTTAFVKLFEDDNPRFSAGRFLEAASYSTTKNPHRRSGWPVGSVSSGTLREEDLLGVFADEAADAYERIGEKPSKTVKDAIREARAILNRMDDDAFAEEDEDAASALLDDLGSFLDEVAPPYIYFGGHPGDPADIGWWPSIESLEEDARSGEVLKVDAGDELPRGYTGLVMDVTDHGNVTLYDAVKGERKTELWGVV